MFFKLKIPMALIIKRICPVSLHNREL